MLGWRFYVKLQRELPCGHVGSSDGQGGCTLCALLAKATQVMQGADQ